MGNGIVHTISNNGAIWSSARVLKCSLKWGNERNPRSMLNIHRRLLSLMEGGSRG